MEFASQALKGIVMPFDAAIGVNVLHFKPATREMTCNQNGAMTFKWFLFGAHQRQAVLVHPLMYSIQPLSKQVRGGYQVVPHSTILVTSRVLGARAEFMP